MKRHILSILLFLLPFLCHAQVVELSTPTAGEYTSNEIIRLLPGFRTTGNFRAYISGSLNVKLNSVPSADQNYVVSRKYKTAGINELSDPNVQEVTETVQYLDGFGRTVQSLLTRGSTLGNDIVSFKEYDNLGRQPKSYLPYAELNSHGDFKSAAATNQSQFYSTSGWDNAVAKTTAPYSQVVYEPSPRHLVLEAGAPGTVWQPAAQRNATEGRTALVSYETNDASTSLSTNGYAVRFWEAVPVSGSDYKRTLATGGYYAAGQLYLAIKKNENWTSADGKAGTAEEYTDKDGLLVLTRRFNKVGGNIQVLSTYYVYDDLGNLSFVLPAGANPDHSSISQASLDSYCYQYRFDSKKRLIEKKIPGKGWDHLVYNALDQLVLSQDSVQRIAGQWYFNKYDGLGRVVYTGLQTNSASRTAAQSTVNSQTVLWERRQSGGMGYSSNAYPQTAASYFVFQYYDDYDFPGAATYPFGGSKHTTGLLTGAATTVLGTSNTLLSVNYYDDEGRPAKVYKQHYQSGAVNTNNYDEVSATYNFEGLLTASNRLHHNASSGNTNIASRYEYDHVGRPLRTFVKINNDAEVKLSENGYNEIGQLKRRALNDGLQQSNYAYNERGWLKTNTSSQFSFQLKYQDGNTPQYNGNISGQAWGGSTPAGNSFAYDYDKLDRLLSGANSSMSEVISYDLMGNIQTLNRDGVTRTYAYDGNKLTSTSGAPGTGTYGYDGNGNATYDGRIEKAITYNSLDLPSAIPSLDLTYTYDATGNKLRKSSNGTITDYVDGIQYENGQIQFIQTEEGFARRNGSSYSYEYNLADHLGNARYTFHKNPITGQIERLQSDDYYAFGLRKSSGNPVSLNNKYLYNGKELQDESGQYDYGARFYDPIIGRWNSIDPMAEASMDAGPYNYVLNNPINFIDPDGMLQDWVQKPNGGTVWDPNVTSPDDPDRRPDDIYLGRSGYGIDPTSGMGIYYNSDGTRSFATQSLAQANIVGNPHSGETQGYLEAAIPAGLTASAVDGPLPIGDAIGAVVVTGAIVRDLTQIKYITYTLTNPTNGKKYVGRSSGYGDPYSIMMNRYYGHHMRSHGYSNPQLDRVSQGYPLGYYAIRGREQDAVDAYGGIGSPLLGNSINPIYKFNPNRPAYRGASSLMFGPYIR